MTAWNDMVKKVAKGNPGKSLKEILPLAKVEYRKTHKVVEHKKKGTHKKKGKKHGVHKKRRQRGGECDSGCAGQHGGDDSNVDTNSGPVPNAGPNAGPNGVGGVGGGGGEPAAYDSGMFDLNAIHQAGGKRRRGKRGSKGKRRSKRGSKAKRRSKGKRSMKNHKKGCKCVICMHHHH